MVQQWTRTLLIIAIQLLICTTYGSSDAYKMLVLTDAAPTSLSTDLTNVSETPLTTSLSTETETSTVPETQDPKTTESTEVTTGETTEETAKTISVHSPTILLTSSTSATSCEPKQEQIAANASGTPWYAIDIPILLVILLAGLCVYLTVKHHRRIGVLIGKKIGKKPGTVTDYDEIVPPLVQRSTTVSTIYDVALEIEQIPISYVSLQSSVQ